MAGSGVDNLSVFFLAQGEQTADAVMAPLTALPRPKSRRARGFVPR